MREIKNRIASPIGRPRFLMTFAAAAILVPIVLLGLSMRARATTPTPSLCYSHQSTLTASDITYLGAIRMPQSGVDTTFATGGMAGRIVNGQVHLFVYGNHNSSNDPVYEIADPGSGYSTDYTQAPRATLVTNWGDVFHGKRTSWDASGAALTLQYVYPGGLYWNENRQLLYWTYNDAYNVTGRPDWGLGGSSLDNPATAQSTAYGPWRTMATDGDGATFYGAWRCSYMFANPTDGSMMCGSTIQSGNSRAPWGPDAYGGQAWPSPTTPGGYGSPDLNLSNRYLEYYYMANTNSANYVDQNGAVHGQLRSFRRTTEQPVWEQLSGNLSLRANPALNSGVGSWAEVDGTTGAIWLELANKRGVIYAGRLAGAASQNPADCTNAAHEWYANASVHPPLGACSHGCLPPVAITGPVTTAAFPSFIVFNPDDLLAVRGGSKTDYSTDPTSVIDLERTYGIHTADIKVVGAAKGIAGFYFDPIRKYLFVISAQLLESLIHVFAINDSPPSP
jgi:hypothetical protein